MLPALLEGVSALPEADAHAAMQSLLEAVSYASKRNDGVIMLLAQLKHKVPAEFEGMEDVLTSSAIGVIKYLPDDLACALLAEFACTPGLTEPLDVDLWPHYPTPPGFVSPTKLPNDDDEPDARGDTEPDAIIRTKDWLILVEAKYRSAVDSSYDQLGREFAVGYRLARKERRQFRLLLVTATTLPPSPGNVDLQTGLMDALSAASARLGRAEAQQMIAEVESSLLWTNWQSLYNIVLAKFCSGNAVASSAERLLNDVCKLLELRGLRPYDIEPMRRAMDLWKASGIPEGAWLAGLPYRYRVVLSVRDGWKQLSQLDVAQLDQLEWIPFRVAKEAVHVS